MVIWYIFPHFGMLCHEKAGNPDPYFELRLGGSEMVVLARLQSSSEGNSSLPQLGRFLFRLENTPPAKQSNWY
jgi:hypothetical protein